MALHERTMMFTDRKEAAVYLVDKLENWKDISAVVLAIPRGGVPLGYIVASHFHWPLDLIMVKKIGMPGQSELAIGAVSIDGEVIDSRFDIDPEYIESEIASIRKNLSERYRALAGKNESISVAAKTVILVDDGMATGNTMIAAIQLLRKQGADQVFVAVPVASDSAYQHVKKLADVVICLTHPSDFMAVGQYYEDFSQVDDDEVKNYLILNS